MRVDCGVDACAGACHPLFKECSKIFTAGRFQCRLHIRKTGLRTAIAAIKSCHCLPELIITQLSPQHVEAHQHFAVTDRFRGSAVA